MDNQPDENCNLLFLHPRNSFSARKPSTEFMRRFSVSLEEDIKETGMHLRNLRIKTPKGDKFGRGSSFISLPKRGHGNRIFRRLFLCVVFLHEHP